MKCKTLIRQTDASKSLPQERGKQSKHLGDFSCEIKLQSVVTETFLAPRL